MTQLIAYFQSFPRDLGRRFLRLTILNILCNIVEPLAGLVDTAMLAHQPDLDQLGGASLGVVLFNYVYWTFGFLRMATTGETAQALGRGDTREEYAVLYRALGTAAIIGVIILVLREPITELGFVLMQVDPPLQAAGREYFRARALGAPASLLNLALLGWFLGRARSQEALALTFTANAVNIVLNYVFIFRLGWGAYGSGLATALSQYSMLVLGLVLFVGAGRPPAVPRAHILAGDRLLRLWRLNRDIMIRTFVLITAFGQFRAFSAGLGTEVIASHTLLLNVLYLAANLVDGPAFAAESLGGIYRGARDTAALRRLIALSFVAGYVLMALFLLPALLFPEASFGVLTDHPAVLARLLVDRWWLLPLMLAGTAAFLYDGIFLGLTEGRPLRNAMLLSYFIGFLPAALAGLYLGRAWLLWLALAVFFLMRALTLGYALARLLAGYEREATPP